MVRLRRPSLLITSTRLQELEVPLACLDPFPAEVSAAIVDHPSHLCRWYASMNDRVEKGHIELLDAKLKKTKQYR
jgi:hypothetical protein